MKHFLSSCKRRCLAVVSMALMALAGVNEVQADVPLRRPISPNRPMLLVHIDTWNYPDPERIIEMVPEDILPYVVFNISLSASDNVCSDGFKVCDSWLKACAQKRVWAMVQFSSISQLHRLEFCRAVLGIWRSAGRRHGDSFFLGAFVAFLRYPENVPALWRLFGGELYAGGLRPGFDADVLYEASSRVEAVADGASGAFHLLREIYDGGCFL